jgi:5-methylcytosine-specific restriction endonuclease McrA
MKRLVLSPCPICKGPRRKREYVTCSYICGAALRKILYPGTFAEVQARTHSNEAQRAESIRRARIGVPRPELRGPNHFNWKGGSHRQRHIEMGRVEYVNWRRAVFERDDYTCQRCYVRGGQLNAHHVKPWCDFPELRYAVSNGMTLCEVCHDTHHAHRRVPKGEEFDVLV